MKLSTQVMHTLAANVLGQKHEPNPTVSPVSVMLGVVVVALAATKNSATHKEACALLKMDPDNEDAFLDECQRLREDLVTDQGDEKVKVSMATSMWCGNVSPAFTLLCQDKLEAQVRPLAGCKAINGWVTENTKGMITEVVTTDPDGPLVVVPVLAFDGLWTYKMEENDGDTSEFHYSPAEEPMQCLMMNLNAKLHYAEIDGVQIVELPYGKCQQFKAYVLLPPVLPSVNGVFSRVDVAIALLADAAGWQCALESLEEQQVYLSMPQFWVQANVSLNENLVELGMPTALGEDPSFGRLSDDPNVYLKNMQHAVKILVNAYGTKAAAATAVVMKSRGTRSKAIDVDVNRPFVFMVTRGECILFASVVRKPEQ